MRAFQLSRWWRRPAVVATVVVVLGALAASPVWAAAQDGSGAMAVTPSSVTAGSSNNRFVFTFTGPGGSNTFGSGSQMSLQVPTGWTAPTTTAGTAGLTTVANATGTSCAPGIVSISAGPPWTILVSQTCSGSDAFTITYGGGTSATNVTAPTSPGPTTFTAKSKVGSGGTLTTLTTGGSLTVAAVGPPTQLVISTQPAASITAGGTVSVGVTVKDSAGDTITIGTGSADTISVALSSGSFAAGSTTATAANGVASFSGLQLNTPGTYTITASDTSRTGVATATTNSITVNPGAPTTLLLTTQPGGAVAGSPLSPQPVVTIRDQFGNTNTTGNSDVIKVTLSAGTFSTGLNNASVTASAGVATFSGLQINTAGTYTMTATDTTHAGAASATSSSFTVTPAAANKLAFTTQPGSGTNATAGASTPVAVSIQDTFGNVVTSDTSTTVTLSLATNPGSSTLQCTNPGGTTATAASGVASFSCSLNKTGTGYKFAAISSPSLTAPTNANTFNVVAASATTIAVVSGSGQSATVNTAFTNPLVALVTDSFGNPKSGVSVTFTGPSTGASGSFATCTSNPQTYSCVATTNASGQVTSSVFTANTTAGSYNVTATAAGTNTVSFSLTNASGAANKLVFTTQPTAGQNIAAGTSTNVGVSVTDSFGNVKTSDNTTTVTLSLATNPGSSTLSCTNPGGTTVTVASGVASFACSLNKTGTGYRFAASSSPSLTAPTNATTFNIIAAAPFQLAFVAQPTNTAVGVSMSPAVTVQVQDQFGNSAAATVSVTLTPSSGTISSGSPVTTASNGLATFSLLKIATANAGLTMTASATNLASSTLSSSFTVYVNVSNSAAALTDTAGDGSGSGIKSVAYSYCAGFAGSCANGTPIGTSTTPAGAFPLTWTNQPVNGNYRVVAVGTDNLNNVSPASAPIPVVVSNTSTKLAITTSAVSGQWSTMANLGPITVQVQDAANNAVNVASDTVVNLTSNSTGNDVFASSPGGAGVTSITIPAGSSSATFYYGDDKPGTPTITATSLPLTSATQQETITAGPATQIVLSGSTGALGSGATRTLTATIQDAAGNTVTTGPDSTATITFSKTTGTGSLSGLGSFAASAGVATDVVTGGNTGSVTVRADVTLTGGSASSGALTFTVTPKPIITFPTSTNRKTVANGTTSAPFNITGTGFQAGAVVTISGAGFINITVNSVNSTTINVTVTAANGNGNRGTYDLTVTNPDGGTATSPQSMVNS